MAAAVQTLTGPSPSPYFTLTLSSPTFLQPATPRIGTTILIFSVPIRECRLPSVFSNQAIRPRTGTMTSLIKRGLPLVLSRNSSLPFAPVLLRVLLPRTGTTISKITITPLLALPDSAPPPPKQKTGTKSSPPMNRRQRTGTTSLGTPRTRIRLTRRTGQ